MEPKRYRGDRQGVGRMTEPWTPGPWQVDTELDEVWGKPTTVTLGVQVGSTSFWTTPELADLNPADARLIAAAPEMAELLERLNEGSYSDRLQVLNEAEALLSRIRGEATYEEAL